MTFYAVFLADFFQRIRGPKFWLILLGVAFITFLMFPGANAKYSVMNIYGYRGLYNSAWMGDTLAVMNGMTMPLFAFYLIKNAIALDRKTGVDVLLKSSLLKNPSYIMGKWLSNFFFLMALVLLMNAVAFLKQFYLGESFVIDLTAHFQGQLLFALPAIVMTAGMAVLFESLPVLRGGIGNMLYLFVWTPLMVLQVEAEMGAQIIIAQMQAAIPEAERLTQSITIGGSAVDGNLANFLWTGIQPVPELFISGLYVLGGTFVILLISMLAFRHRRGKLWRPKFFRGKTSQPIKKKPGRSLTLTPISSLGSRLGVFQLLRGEVQLMFRSHHPFWYIGALILIGLGFGLPTETVTTVMLPLTAIWGTLILSQLGCRDEKHNTLVLMASSSFGESLRLSAAWVSGVILQLTLFSGLLLHFLLQGQTDAILTLLTAALFIPAFAIFLGRVTATSRSFEFLYMALWYIGPVDHTPTFDFLGTTLATSPPAYGTFLAATGVLVGATILIGQREKVGRVFAN